MIVVKGLIKRSHSFEVLNGIELDIKKGEVYGLLGHDVYGKSSMMKILSGLSKPDKGSCIVNGWDLAKIEHPGDLHIGYLPDDPQFYSWMTAQENLLFLGSRLKKEHLYRKVNEMLEWVGLSEAANTRISEFSQGMKQRLGMSSAMIFDPELLLLHEPCSTLNFKDRNDILNLILDLKSKGKTVFLSTPILNDVERVCDRVGIFYQGRIIVDEPVKQLFSNHVLTTYRITLKQIPNSEFIGGIRELPGVIDCETHFKTLSIKAENPQTVCWVLLTYVDLASVVVESFKIESATLEDISLKGVSKHGNV